MIFNYDANKTHFHNKGFALSLVLRVRFFGTRKWPINMKRFSCRLYIDSKLGSSQCNQWGAWIRINGQLAVCFSKLLVFIQYNTFCLVLAEAAQWIRLLASLVRYKTELLQSLSHNKSHNGSTKHPYPPAPTPTEGNGHSGTCSPRFFFQGVWSGGRGTCQT